MATNKKDNFARSIQEYIKAGLREETEKIAKSYQEQIIKDVEDVMSDVVAKMSVRLAKYYKVEDLKDQIVITIHKDFTG